MHSALLLTCIKRYQILVFLRAEFTVNDMHMNQGKTCEDLDQLDYETSQTRVFAVHLVGN